MNYILFINAFKNKYSGIQDQQLLFQYLREELQYLILYILYTKTTYPVYFMGGTKLRLSYHINRFSEDIDLALDKPNLSFSADKFFSDITKFFSEKVTGFHLHTQGNTNNNVVKLMLSFSQILFDIGISSLQEQTIKIKIELDINPPNSAIYEKKTYHSLAGDFMINTHDLSTSFSGKLAAILFREYQKGRDYYDLQWYLDRQPKIFINMDYLNANALQQGKKIFNSFREVLTSVASNVASLDISLMKLDLERFIIMDDISFDDWLNQYIQQTLELLDSYQKFYESR